MGLFGVLFLFFATGMAATDPEKLYEENRRIAKAIVESLQDPKFDEELLFDLKKENQVYVNRTMSLVIKYIVKREVDNYRSRRTDAISRRIYSALIMKLIDIAKDMPRNASAASRVDTAHRYYMSVEARDMHDKMADAQVPRILSQLGKSEDLTPKVLVRKLASIDIKPVHLAIALLIQYHLRNTINFAVQSKAIDILATRPQMVGEQVIDTLKALATHLLPVAELLDIHLAHSSPAFKDTCPSTWLGIVNNNNKQA